MAVPPVIAAKTLGIPVFVHESDLSMGLANRIAYKFATTMYSTFEQSEALTKVKHVGAVTKVSATKNETSPQLEEIKAHFNPDLKTILFIGGSAGAKVFNDFVSREDTLTQHFNVINITGDSSLNVLDENCYRVDYVTDI